MESVNNVCYIQTATKNRKFCVLFDIGLSITALGSVSDIYMQITFFLLDLTSIFVNGLSIMHIQSNTRFIINSISKLCEFCHCTYSGVFELAFSTNENAFNNNNNDYLKANNNSNTLQSSSANTNCNDTNNNNNNSKHIHRTMSSNGVTVTSATTIDGNCTNIRSSINTINDNIKVNWHLNLNNYQSKPHGELGVSGFAAAVSVVSALTLSTHASIATSRSVHSGNNGIGSVNTAEKSCDLLKIHALSVTIVLLSGISSTISPIAIETCTKENTETKSNVIAKQKHNAKKWFDTQSTREFPSRFTKNSIVNSNDKRCCSNIDNKNISKVTYNVKTCQECLEIIKFKVG